MSFRGKPSQQGGRRLRRFSVFTSPPPSVYGGLSVFICLSSSTGPPRMSPKSQRTPRAHRVPPCRTTGVPPGVDLISHNAPGEVPVTPPTRSSSSGGTWSSVVSGGKIVLSFLFFFLFLYSLCVFIFIHFQPYEHFSTSLRSPRNISAKEIGLYDLAPAQCFEGPCCERPQKVFHQYFPPFIVYAPYSMMSANPYLPFNVGQ